MVESVEDCFDAIFMWDVEIEGLYINSCKGTVCGNWGALYYGYEVTTVSEVRGNFRCMWF